MSRPKQPPLAESQEESTARFHQKLAKLRAELLQQPKPTFGPQIGEYLLKEKIGQGGDGVVYQVQHQQTGASYAMKILHLAPNKQQEQSIARFQREAVVLGALSHPNVVGLIDFGITPGGQGFYLVTELLQGRNLKQLLASGEDFDMTRLTQIIEQICQALHHAHEHGIYHRDIKPGNIFLERSPGGPETIKLIDFGIAGMAEAEGDLTETGMHIGTPYYMSPEQALGQAREATAPSDLYSLGVVLFQLLTGQLPFESANPVGMIFHHAYTPPPRLSEIIPNVIWSSTLDNFLQRALAKAPLQRPQRALAFAQECKGALSEQALLLSTLGFDTVPKPTQQGNAPRPLQPPQRDEVSHSTMHLDAEDLLEDLPTLGHPHVESTPPQPIAQGASHPTHENAATTVGTPPTLDADVHLAASTESVLDAIIDPNLASSLDLALDLDGILQASKTQVVPPASPSPINRDAFHSGNDSATKRIQALDNASIQQIAQQASQATGVDAFAPAEHNDESSSTVATASIEPTGTLHHRDDADDVDGDSIDTIDTDGDSIDTVDTAPDEETETLLVEREVGEVSEIIELDALDIIEAPTDNTQITSHSPAEEELPLVVGAVIAETPAPPTVTDAFALEDDAQTEFSLSTLGSEDTELPAAQKPHTDGLQLLQDIAHTAIEEHQQSDKYGPLVHNRLKRHNIPSGLPYVELPTREQELHRMHNHFGLGSRLLCLAGPEGIGKSTLMLQFGQIYRSEYPGGVWYCDMSTTSDMTGLCRLMGESLGAPLTQDNDIVQLGNALHGRGRCLVLFDHCTELAGQFSQTIALWMQRAPEAHFLFSSHVAFHITTEDNLHLAPLPPEDALQLLLACTNARQRPHEAELLHKLTATVGGHPQSLVLLAGLLELMSPDAVYQALKASPHNAPMQLLLQQMWPFLTATERSVILHCVPFGGHMAREALLELMPEQADRATLALSALQQRGLLQELSYGQQKRLRVPNIISHFIQRDTDTHPAELQHHENQVAQHYASLGQPERLAHLWPANAQILWQRQLARREHLHALHWSLQQQQLDLACQIYIGLIPTYEERGPFIEALQLGHQIAQHPKAETLSPLHQASLQWAIGHLYLLTKQIPQAQEWLHYAQQSANSQQATRLEGIILTHKGDLLHQQQETQSALRCYEDALAVHQRSDIQNHIFAAHTKSRIGLLHAERGQASQCLSCFEEAYSLYMQIQHKRNEGTIFGLWGSHSTQRGRYTEALEFYSQALTLAQAQDDWQLEANTLCQQGRVFTEQGRLTKARSHLEAALALLRFLGNRKEESDLLGLLGRLCRQQRQPKDAAYYFEQAIQAAREVGIPTLIAQNQGQLGELMMTMGEMEQAKEHMTHAVLLFRNLQSPQEGAYLGALAELHLTHGESNKAADYLQRAEELLRQTRYNPLELARLLCRRALFELKTGHAPKAHQTLQQAEEIGRQCNVEPNSPLMRAIQKLRQFQT